MRVPKMPKGEGYYLYAHQVVHDGECYVHEADVDGVCRFLERSGWEPICFPSQTNSGMVHITAERKFGK